MYIYLITNKINGKYYVGQTIRNLEDRWFEHLRVSVNKDSPGRRNSRLYVAMRKHGPQNFNIELLCACPSQMDLDNAEKFFIQFLASHNKFLGYNGNFGGCGGRKTKETRDKISKTLTGRKLSEEHKAKISASQKGKPKQKFSDSHRKALSLSAKRKRKQLTQETKEKISRAHRGRKFSEQHRANLREAWIERANHKKSSRAS